MKNQTVSHNFLRLFNTDTLFAPKNFLPIDNIPICLEIGAGRGKHACDFAKNNPDKTLYAIERTTDKFTSFQKSAQADDLPNLHAIHADAIAWSVFALYPKQVTTCFILYPNPEPHNKNQRWHNMPFFEFLLSRLADDGQIIMASNILEYIDEAKEQLEYSWRLPFDCHNVDKDSNRTHFETKYLQRGEPCQQLVITKPAEYATRFDDVLPKILDSL